MTFELIAAEAIAFVLPYLGKAGEEIAQKAGSDIWETIKKSFKSEKDKGLIKELESQPKNLKSVAKIELKLAEKLEEDEAFFKSLTALIENAKSANIQNTTNYIQQISYGSGDNIGRDKIVNQ
jgi:hypothetical protein